MNVTELLLRLLIKIGNIYLFKIIIKIKNMETSSKTGFAQIFSCCPKNLSCPNFGGAAVPLAPPARMPMLFELFLCPVNECYGISKDRHRPSINSFYYITTLIFFVSLVFICSYITLSVSGISINIYSGFLQPMTLFLFPQAIVFHQMLLLFLS